MSQDEQDYASGLKNSKPIFDKDAIARACLTGSKLDELEKRIEKLEVEVNQKLEISLANELQARICKLEAKQPEKKEDESELVKLLGKYSLEIRELAIKKVKAKRFVSFLTVDIIEILENL